MYFNCFIGFFIKYTFPIRDKDTSDKIAEGIAKHMKGEPSVDPLTGKSISLLKLTPEEEGTVWYFENFSSKQLEGLLGEAGAGPIAASATPCRPIHNCSLVSWSWVPTD